MIASEAVGLRLVDGRSVSTDDHAAVRSDLPTGTVTFVFTDVEGSTKLLRELGAKAYADALADARLQAPTRRTRSRGWGYPCTFLFPRARACAREKHRSSKRGDEDTPLRPNARRAA